MRILYYPQARTSNLTSCRSLERDREVRKKHKRDRSTSVSSSTNSEEDRRRRERKERKRARKEKDRRKRRHRRSETPSDDEDRKRRHDSRRKRSRSPSGERRKTQSRTQSPRRVQSNDEDEWVEKSAPSGSFIPTVPSTIPTLNISPPSITQNAQRSGIDNDASDEEVVGPQPVLAPSTTKKLDERAYGGALLRGEGSAMAAFLQDGTDVRIPRRGEIGLTSNEIDNFEAVGYVMSGSRHRRMNAVRMRKENQVISAEEKRGILKLQQEEKQRREAILREEFQELLTDRLRGTEGTKTS